MNKYSSLDDAVEDDFYFLICTSQFSKLSPIKLWNTFPRHKRVYTVLFHLYEVKKQEKLIHGDRFL